MSHASELMRQLDELHLRFQLHFADHVRLTRDLEALSVLVAEARAIGAAGVGLPTDPDSVRLQIALERRLEFYEEAQGAIAQAHAAAGLRDREASLLTGRARLVLHRYVRHFAGHARRTRDPKRLDEMIADLLELWALLEPMAERLQVPSVAEEVSAVGQFIGFFYQERAQLQEAWTAGDRLAQSDALAEVVQNAQADWEALVVGTPRALRRLALLDRLIATVDLALESLAAVRHANLPDVHEARVAATAEILAAWQAERAETEASHAQTPTPLTDIHEHGRQLYRQWRAEITRDKATRDIRTLAVLCDQTEEVERLLTKRLGALPDPGLTWLRDVLVAMERSYDTLVAAQEKG